MLSRLFVVAGVLLLCASPVRGTGLAIEYFHAGFGHFFVTAFAEEAAALDDNPASGWTRTGASFLVDTDDAQGAAPVCRFFSAAFAPRSSHFYTPYAAECATVKANPTWTYEAIAFHLQLPDAAGACPAGTDVLYRLYNDGSTGAPNHRYTSSAAVFAAYKAKGWIAEGHGGTGAFACTPARPAGLVAGNVTGVADLRPAVRTLTPAEAAELVSVTDTALTFATPVALLAGDVFVVERVGVFSVVGVTDVAGRRVVQVQSPTVDEIFANLELAGSVPLAAGYFSEPSARMPSGESGAPALRPRKFEAVASTYQGAPGIRLAWSYETHCGTGAQKMTPFTVALGLYGDVKIDYRKSRLEDAVSISTAYVVPSATLSAGCRIKIPGKRFKIGQWSVPIFNGAFFIDIPIFVRMRFETDLVPVIALAFGDVEIRVDTTTGGTNATVRGGAIDMTALTLSLAPNASIAASTAIEADASLRLVTFWSFHLGSLGARSGPSLELKGTVGVASSICGTLGMPTQVYYQYRAGRKMTEKLLYQADIELQKTGLGCESVNGPWSFTTRTCTTLPAGCAECVSGFERDLKFNSDKSSLDWLFSGTPHISARLERPPAGTVPPPPARYLGGCGNATVAATFVPDCATSVGMTFATDYRTASFVASQSPAEGCLAILEGDARRQ